MNEVNIQRHQTKIGKLVFGSFGGKLCLLGFGDREMRRRVDDRIRKKLHAEFVAQSDKVLEQTMKQVDEYLSGNRKEFDMPLLIMGTDFQKRV